MIRASDISAATESIAKPGNEIDLFLALHSLLERWSTTEEVQPVELLMIKRHIPLITYTGRAHRFIFVNWDDEEAFYPEDASIYPSGVKKKEDSDKLIKQYFDLREFRRYVTSHEKGKGRLVSWAMSLGGLLRELELQDLDMYGNSNNGTVYVMESIISGFDLAGAAKFLCNLENKIRKETGESPLKRYFKKSTRSDKVWSDKVKITPEGLRDDFRQSEEILAPMTSDFKVIAIFPPRYSDILMDF